MKGGGVRWGRVGGDSVSGGEEAEEGLGGRKGRRANCGWQWC